MLGYNKALCDSMVILTWVPLDVHFGKDIRGRKYESQQIS